MKTNILFVTGALVVGGCASSKASEQPTTPESEAAPPAVDQQPGMRGGMMGGDPMADICPMAVEGNTARAEPVEGGATMVFMTTGDVAELRQRVAAMAEMHNSRDARGNGRGMGMHGSRGGMHGAKGNGGRGMKGKAMMMPASTARSEDAESGARLVFTPQDPADLAALRERVAQHAEMMASGRCPMMSAPHQH
jgi:hypothetical protein